MVIASREASRVPLRARLRILGTTDLHATVWPFDYATDTPRPTGGLARLATLIGAARAEVPDSLLFDAGDMLQGTALADAAARRLAEGTVHPVIAAMNSLGYDAVALGNHDFDFGLGFLERAVAQARFPCLCANLLDSDGGTPHFPATALIDRRLTSAPDAPGLRIGVMGMAPPQTLRWGPLDLGCVLRACGIVDAARDAAARLRAGGADLVVAICHAGMDRDGEEDETAAIAVAALDDVDAVLAGHTHKRCARVAPKTGTAIMPGAFGGDLGIIDLDLVRDGGRWQVAGSESCLRPATSAVTPDPAILDLTRPAHDGARRRLRRPIARLTTRLHSMFALAAHAPALQFVAGAQAARAGTLVAGSELAGLPLVSAVAPFFTGGRADPHAFVDIPPGPLRGRHLLQLAPFANPICVLETTGGVLRDWLEHAAAVLRTVPRGARDAPLVDPGTPGYRFDVIFGLTYVIDLTRPPHGGRIRDLRHDGEAIRETDRFAVATNSFRASGGGGYTMVPQTTTRIVDSISQRAALADHARTLGDIVLSPQPAWRFRRIGATVLLRSGQGARLDLHGDEAMRMEPLPPDSEGFSRFRIHL